MNTPFHAILFDMDGTLLDTREFIFRAWEHVIQRHNLPVRSREEIVSHITKTLPDTYSALYPGHDAIALMETHRDFQLENLHLARVFEKTVHTLEELTKAGKPCVVISTRGRNSIITALKAAGIIHYFDHIVSTDDITAVKPDPEPVLKALQMLGCSADSAVMIGDTDADIISGKSAGTKTIGVTYGFHGSDVIRHQPDFVVDEISQILPIILGVSHHAV